jgi:Kef-type K+ transport system membrane component KefB
MSFLPTLPNEFDAFARVALLMIGAIGLAELGERVLRLPRVTGYIAAGMIFGPGVLGWTPASVNSDLRPLMLLGLGLLLFELGSRVDLRWLRHNPMLIASSFLESALTFGIVVLFLTWFHLPQAAVVCVAAIAVSTSPAVVMRVVAENNARGQLTQRLLLMTALNSLYAIILLKVGLAFAHLEQNSGIWQAVAHPVYVASGSFLLAALIAYGMHRARLARIRRESERFTLIVAVVLLGTTVADHLGLSVPMSLLCGGILLRTISQRLQLFPEHFGSAGAMLVVVLFALTGVALDFRQLIAGGLLAFALILIRAISKFVGARIFAGYGGLSPEKSSWLGVALLPMSSLAVLQAYDLTDLYPGFSNEGLPIVLGAVVIMELAGPIATQIALRRAGEAMNSTVRP